MAVVRQASFMDSFPTRQSPFQHLPRNKSADCEQLRRRLRQWQQVRTWARLIREAESLWHVDVRDSNQVSGGVMAAEQWLEGVDILINLAGILQGASINIEEFPDEVWDSVVGINLTGSYLMVKHVSNYMIKQKKGVIILTSSGAGVLGGSSSYAYGSSKGGVHGLSLVMMDKLSQYGIRVHDILPGSVDTPLKNSQIETTRDITGNQDEYKNVKKILVNPEGIAKIIYFMCSDEAGLLKGSIRTE